MAPHFSYSFDISFRQQRPGLFFCAATVHYINALSNHDLRPLPEFQNCILCISLFHKKTNKPILMIPRQSNRSAYYTTSAGDESQHTQVLVALDKEDAHALAANDRIGVVTAEKFAMYVVPWIEIPMGGGETLGECLLRAELVTPSSLVGMSVTPPTVPTATRSTVGGVVGKEPGVWHLLASVDKVIDFAEQGALQTPTGKTKLPRPSRFIEHLDE